MHLHLPIREQLICLVLLLVLCALCIVTLPTWKFVDDFVRQVESNGLTLTASLKASGITAELALIQTSCLTISSRVLIQAAFQDFYRTGKADWQDVASDVGSALSVADSTGLLQAKFYSRNETGASPDGLLRVTGTSIPDITLPYAAPNGSVVKLGDPVYGYPPDLFPNITYVGLGYNSSISPSSPAVAAEAFPGVGISAASGLLLGPLVLNDSAALISISVPVRNNSNAFALGYMTIVALATSVIQSEYVRQGMGSTGMLLVVGPVNPWNRFNTTTAASNSTYRPTRGSFGDVDVHFVFPPRPPYPGSDRHSERTYAQGTWDEPFEVKDYPACLDAFADKDTSTNNASALLTTHNEQGQPVSVGFARTQTPLVNWTVIIEESQGEAMQPIYVLRKILLGTSFGTVGLFCILLWPVAHFGVKPIRLLKAATEKSVNPPGWDESSIESEGEHEVVDAVSAKKGIRIYFVKMLKRRPKPRDSEGDRARKMFNIPGKVEERRHFFKDELTELTRVFNDMSDELVKQYLSLDQKVAERTQALEESKKAAEAANESKTLFIANISHELKTPLNGILGMCAVSMEENDITKIKQSLKTLYKSGDLLLHLLEDLLSFSKNQIGHQLSLEMKEFRLADIRSQILAVFDKQVRETGIDFVVKFVPPSALDTYDLTFDSEKAEPMLPVLGPAGTGRLKDISVWGDQHRILQVLINLVSNSLKFTPPDGRVEVRIKCLGEDDSPRVKGDSRTSSVSKVSRRSHARLAKSSSTAGSDAVDGQGFDFGGTALSINPMDPSKAIPHLDVGDSSPTPPPAGAKSYIFEFEVHDTGPGIPENMQQKVFEPFVQGDLGLSKKYGGTGLGLSICHQLAKLMNGSITLHSRVGVGTLFKMRIPLQMMKERWERPVIPSVLPHCADMLLLGPLALRPASTARWPQVTSATVSRRPRAEGRF